MSEPIPVSDRAVLDSVIEQRNAALTELAISQAACRQLAARVRELEQTDDRKVPDGTA